MREIKFRAWDDFNKCYHYADMFEYYIMEEWITWKYPENSPSNEGEHWDIEQYTGLKDFYEGDYFREKGYKTIYVIEFKNGMFCYKIFGDYKPLATILDFIDDIEKCGNIHEGEITCTKKKWKN